MNTFLTLCLLAVCALQSYAQPFITTWKTDNEGGVSGSNQITIPTTGTGYSYSISWEKVDNTAINGTITGPITGNYTITFPSPGIYRVSITGAFPRIFFDGDSKTFVVSDYKKILTVEQWGSIVWTSMGHAFSGCENLTITAKDAPNLTQVKDMSYMFNYAKSLNQPLEAWDVSSVTDMSLMFGNAIIFNQPLERWNVSKVTNMRSMFAGARSFNQPLASWDVSSVTDMAGMFAIASSFNQPLESWNVSNVTGMSTMFLFADRFNQPLEKWDVSSVIDMQSMLSFATSFNQPLEKWNVTNVRYMPQMFLGATSFNRPLGKWNIKKVEQMKDMLSGSGLGIANYDQTLIGWAAQDVKLNVELGANGLKYCVAEPDREKLITTKGWKITGDSRTSLPPPQLFVSQPTCVGTTGTIVATIQNAGDTFSFDNGVTFQASNIKSGLTANTYSVIVKNSAGCQSPPATAEVNLPIDPIEPTISGSSVVCPNVTAVEYSANIDDYTYDWQISGGTIVSKQNNKIIVDWGPSNFNAWIKTTAKDKNNCPTDTVAFPVKVQIQLKPAIPSGMDSVCYNFRSGVPYQTSSTTGSVYTWFTNGGVVSEGQTKPLVKIDWADLGQYKLWVKEENTTSTDYCEGFSDTLKVTVFKDIAAITMDFVSVDFKDNKKVQIQWDASLLERISDLIIVSRRIAGSNEPWEKLATLQKNVQSFLDQNVQTDQNVYEYKVEGFNKCDEGLQTVIHNTIKLDGDKDEAQELIDLFWNDYNGWDGVERYEVWRKLDNDTTYRLIDITPGDITNYSGEHGADGFVHTLRIKAKKKSENTISWSNAIELKFDNPIDFIPNVITPNGDSKNDSFFIPKLHLYPDNALMIYDRWGQQVFSKKNYSNDWSAEGLPGGVYFYSLIINGGAKNLKGWLHVIRD